MGSLCHLLDEPFCQARVHGSANAQKPRQLPRLSHGTRSAGASKIWRCADKLWGWFETPDKECSYFAGTARLPSARSSRQWCGVGYGVNARSSWCPR